MFLSQLESEQVFTKCWTCVGAFTRVQQASVDLLCHIFVFRQRRNFNTQNVRWMKMVTKIWRLDYSQLTTFRKSVLSPVVFNKWLAVVELKCLFFFFFFFFRHPALEEQRPTSADENSLISATLWLFIVFSFNAQKHKTVSSSSWLPIKHHAVLFCHLRPESSLFGCLLAP